MTIRIVVDVFSGRPNPVIELKGQRARRVLDQIKPVERLSASAAPAPPISRLGYRGLIIGQIDDRVKNYPKLFRIFEGFLFGPKQASRLADPSFEEDFLSDTGPIASSDHPPRFRLDGLLNFRGSASEAIVQPAPELEEPRPCRCGPLYEPGWWNDAGQKQGHNNCYNYATDYRTDTFAQPGRAAGTAYTVLGQALSGLAIPAGALLAAGTMYAAFTCNSVRAAAVRDALISPDPQENECPDEGHLVALVVAPRYDYHWFRKDRGGYWSHKPGSTPLTNLDNSGMRIIDPRTANRGPYTSF